jgi:hypothetical protein
MNFAKTIATTAATLLAAAGTALAGAEQSTTITYQGYLQEQGAPYNDGTATLHARIMSAPAGGTTVASTGFSGQMVEVDPRTGFFTAELNLNAVAYDADNNLIPIFNGQDRYLRITVNGEALEPFTKINPAPIAADIVDSAKIWRTDGQTTWLAQGSLEVDGFSRFNGTVSAEALSFSTLSGAQINATNVNTNNVTTGILQITGGSDIAEPFNVAGGAEPGMVVSIDPDRLGEMRISESAYDSRVAGVISGAGGVNPGLTLTQVGTVADGEHPVALSGRVWCYVDADAAGPVAPGDLLTTSPTPGHAMKATDASRAHGAVIGKAMSSLDGGRGLVLVLVNLQ